MNNKLILVLPRLWCPHLRLVAELLWSTGWDVEWFWSYVCYFSTLFQLPYLSFNISSLWNRSDWDFQIGHLERETLFWGTSASAHWFLDHFLSFSFGLKLRMRGVGAWRFPSETPGPHLANQRKASQNELRKNMQWSWVSSKRTWWKMLKGVAIVPSNWWRFTSPRTINVHALSWDQAPNGGACRKGMQYPSECLKRGNEVHFWRLWGHGVCMVDHLQNKNRRGPPASESFQVHGQFPNQNYHKIESKFTSLHRREGYIFFSLSRLRSFRESAWLQFRRTPMPLCKLCADETGRNRKKPRKCIRYFHIISQLVQSFVLVSCKR